MASNSFIIFEFSWQDTGCKLGSSLDAWNEATNNSLHKAWKHLLPESEPFKPSEDSTPSEERISDKVELVTDFQEAVAEWLDSDLTDPRPPDHGG